MIETGLRTLLLEQDGITAIAGAQVVENVRFERIFNEWPAQGVEPPFIVVRQTEFDPMEALDGTYGLQATDFEIDCYSRDFSEAARLADQVSEYLKDYSGPAGPSDVIKSVNWTMKRTNPLVEDAGGDLRSHIITLGFHILHQLATDV